MASTASAPTPPSSSTPTTNPRGIPVFPFMSSVSEYCSSQSDVEPTLNRFSEMINKYTFMQSSVEKRAQGLREKIPEIKGTLDVVKFLRRRRGEKKKRRSSSSSQKELEEKVKTLEVEDEDEDEEERTSRAEDRIETTFPLNDTLYARAHITPATLDSVYLWLGANVMVSYPLAEAEELLAEKLSKATDSLAAAEEDLEFLRVQITTLEVATARVYNWDVGEKRKKRKGDEETRKMVGIRDGEEEE